MKRDSFLTALALMLLAPPSTLAAAGLTPGQYEYTVRMSMPGAPANIPPQTMQRCLSAKDVAGNAAFHSASGPDRASAYARLGLFKRLGSFAELELRIAQLATDKERGDAFEVFVEAYLSTDEMMQAAEVWVIGKVPGEIRRQIHAPH